MKVGRFGVSTDFKGQGIGTSILDYLKEMFITNNRTGCRYITVDAYRESLYKIRHSTDVFRFNPFIVSGKNGALPPKKSL